MTTGQPEQGSGETLPDYVRSAEFIKSMQELFDNQLPLLATRATSVKPNAIGSIEWCHKAGGYLLEKRAELGLSRTEMAELMGVPKSQVLFLETGFASLEEILNLAPKYAAALNTPPEFYERFRKQFGIKDHVSYRFS